MDNFKNEVLQALTTISGFICKSSISIISLQGQKSFFYIDSGTHISEKSLTPLLSQTDYNDLISGDITGDKFFNGPEVQFRFAAGFPLLNKEGVRIGKIMSLDFLPRKLSGKQRKAVQIIANFSIGLMEHVESQQLLFQSFGLQVPVNILLDYELLKPVNTMIELSKILTDQENSLRSSHEFYNRSLDKLLAVIDKLNFKSKFDSPDRIQKFRLRYLLNDLLQNYSDRQCNIKFTYDFAIPELLEGDKIRVLMALKQFISSNIKDKGIPQVDLIVESFCKGEESIKISVTLYDHEEDKPFEDYMARRQKMLEQLHEPIQALRGEFVYRCDCKNIILNLGIADDRHSTEVSQVKEDLLGINLLLVEDLELNKEIVGKFLKKWGINYEIASNGEEAILAVSRRSYDVILMDMYMPVLDGFTAVKRIHTMENGAFKNLPIIALTAATLEPWDEKIKDLNLAGCIAKPFNPADLRHAIAKATCLN